MGLMYGCDVSYCKSPAVIELKGGYTQRYCRAHAVAFGYGAYIEEDKTEEILRRLKAIEDSLAPDKQK